LFAEGSGYVFVPETNAVIHSFDALPTFFDSGESVTLSWAVSDADSVMIDQGIGSVASTGTVVVLPTNTTTWTLTALHGSNAVVAETTATLLELTPSELIQINFCIGLNDENLIDDDEASVSGLSGMMPVRGTGWTNLLLRTAGGGEPTVFTAATQSGNQINLTDSSGQNTGVALTSDGSFFANLANVSGGNADASGDAGLLNSALFLNNTETLQFSGLSAWATNGYRVRVFFDIGNATRTYALSMSDGGGMQMFWTKDSPVDSDLNDDGVMTWIETAATGSAEGVPDANHALFGLFTGDSLTISGGGAGARAVLSGIQIIPSKEPIATIVSFSASPSTVAFGESTTLSWEVENADSVTLDHGIGEVGATGEVVVKADDKTTNLNEWILTATRGSNAVSASAGVAVTNFGKIDVYLLGGQSNMEGKGRSSELPVNLLNMPEVVYYNAMYNAADGTQNRLVNLQPGTKFGPE
ncbi:hypothetical protein P4B35_23675, partial [Pontiellaceae bacterium B12227]|nr:hypothetical protein [Pontiellaceae bacterium B12227]